MANFFSIYVNQLKIYKNQLFIKMDWGFKMIFAQKHTIFLRICGSFAKNLT